MKVIARPPCKMAETLPSATLWMMAPNLNFGATCRAATQCGVAVRMGCSASWLLTGLGLASLWAWTPLLVRPSEKLFPASFCPSPSCGTYPQSWAPTPRLVVPLPCFSTCLRNTARWIRLVVSRWPLQKARGKTLNFKWNSRDWLSTCSTFCP